MNELFEKSRELAKALLETKEGKAYNQAKYLFESDDDAVKTLNAYSSKSNELQKAMQNGESGPEFEAKRDELKDFVAKMREVEVITEFFRTEGEFNKLLSGVMEIFDATLTGESEEKKGCSSGGCGGCGGC